MTIFIQLDRRYLEWSEEDSTDPELRSEYGRQHGQTWDDLLLRPRVVVLAEAGSGKSEELKAQAARKASAGAFAFYATVQDVARKGLEDALHPRERERFAAWRASNDIGWFFVDSVDEAKLDGIRLDQACRQLATSVHGAEARSRIILSGRLTDWEFRRDLARLNDELPIVTEKQPLASLSADEFVLRAIRDESSEETEQQPETPLVVVMMPLDQRRVRLFAEGQDIRGADLEAFIRQVDAANLWHFARRPLDLDWMVQFWRTHHRLGTLSEMLLTSLTERLKEPNSDRVRHDTLDIRRALNAIERVGAALVLTRTKTIAIPDATLSLQDQPSQLNLGKVLSDLSEAERSRLLTRPVFDPATFGRARLHNDNLGVVSAFLAARWLLRLHTANLPQVEILDLLFAESYGIPLVKPSMQETAAWVAISLPHVATIIANISPFLLLTAGDPASLPLSTRNAALEGCVNLLASDVEAPMLDNDSVTRFAQPDLCDAIHKLWAGHSDKPKVQKFLLRLIWLGRLSGCSDIASAVAFSNSSADPSLPLFATRAVCASADENTKRRYKNHVISRLGRDRNAVVWTLVEELFPGLLDIQELLTILAAIDVTDSDGSNFAYFGPRLVEQVQSIGDLQELLSGLLRLLGTTPLPIGYQPNDREEAFFPSIGTAANRLLKLSPATDAPLIAIDAVLRLGEYRHDHHAGGAVAEPRTELARTTERRRKAFWRAAESFNGSPLFQGQPPEYPWQMETLGYPPQLTIEDAEWLLRDAPLRSAEHEQRLAINSALQIWRDAGSPTGLLGRIQDVTRSNQVLAAVLRLWTEAPPPPSPEHLKHQAEMQRLTEEGRRRRAEIDQSWIDLAAQMRANPGQLRQLNPPSDKGVDARLLHLWELLHRVNLHRSRYAIDDIRPLEAMIGTEAAGAVRDGLMSLWRQWKPCPKSEREPTDLNRISSIDCMGIAGITLEAKYSPNWSSALTADEARRATVYATLEINGFPSWVATLASTHPNEVREILLRENLWEIDRPNQGTHADILGDIERGDPTLASVMASALLKVLQDRPVMPALHLEPMLRIIGRGLSSDERKPFADLCLERFKVTADPSVSCLYLQAVFLIDANEATDALLNKLNGLSENDQTVLATHVLPTIFGDQFGRDGLLPSQIPATVLERLVLVAYRTIRIEDDRNRPSGEVYSPDTRDHAEGARGAVFRRLAQTPGRATFDAVNRLARVKDFPIGRARLTQIAFERAAVDAETAAWDAADFLAFERSFETAPSTAKDLLRVAMRLFADIQHDLLHSDFAQGQSLQALPTETDVQTWVADRLRLKQGRSYSVEREPHVVEEKEPDIRVRAKPTDVSVPIEVKVAESWTLEELETALTRQLCERYLRAHDGQHGLLLLVHQTPRKKGWLNRKTGQYLSFPQMVTHLGRLATEICGASWDGPQPEIAILDVSSCEAQRRTIKSRQRAKSKPAKMAQRRSNNQSKPLAKTKQARKPLRRSKTDRRRPSKSARRRS